MNLDPVSPIFDPARTAVVYGFENVEEYQKWHSLEPDGVAGPLTTASMVAPRCGLPDWQGGRETVYAHWPRTCMEVATAYRLGGLNLDDETVESAWKTALTKWNRACGISMELIDSMQEAQIWARAKALPGSTLAWSYLPNGKCRERLEQAYDTTVTWNHDFLAKTILHEIGHAIGLTHSNRQADIMYPSITGRQLSTYPSPNDKRRVVSFYGQAGPDDPDPDEPDDPGDPVGSRITVTGGSLATGTYTLRKV